MRQWLIRRLWRLLARLGDPRAVALHERAQDVDAVLCEGPTPIDIARRVAETHARVMFVLEKEREAIQLGREDR